MKRLLASTKGLTTVEFALVGPCFLMMMMFIIDGARAVWTYQTLQEVATNSARCAALNKTGCTNSSEVKSFAVARARASGLTLADTSVTLATAQTCNAMGGMTKVTISSPYAGATTRLLPSTITTLTTDSCFPTIS